MNDLWIDWAKRLRRARQDRDLTQEQAASLVGVDQTTWSRWECARSTPPDGMKATIAEHLGVSLADLFPWPDAVAS